MEDIEFIPNEIYTELKVTETELKNNYIFLNYHLFIQKNKL